ncbi:MAG: hypothetical protein A2286_01985 [Gammaproteobacteria bacterium RIFOXYA12_FULL_61_12]|nr:MAG: hypothetical protein A2514_07950 [Gammaproteobacteria bacterium RIFOXYD12_FULL_61_37]OGT93813.1 MAG: hypothetical protein A2286_01985 [Gammaproteobacteria bacterium RIFOXYA12_FULL_61_12]
MLELGVRPHLVAHAMGLPQPTLISWYQQITGDRTKRGPLKTGAASYVRDRSGAERLSVFCVLYRTLQRDQTPSAEHLIAAIEMYNRLQPEPIDGTLAWMAARELDASRESGRDDMLKLRFCTSCKLPHVYHLQSVALRKCPFCRPCAVSGKRRGRKREQVDSDSQLILPD